MIAKPLARPLPNASLPRNTFDRSFIKNFNMSSGMILPLFCQFVPTGTKGRINRSIFMRTAQLNTAAFPTLDFNIDFYCVPMPLLMTRYDEFKTNTHDLNSSAFGPTNTLTVPGRLPYFKYVDVKSMLATGGSGGTQPVDDLGAIEEYGTRRLFDLLGYDDTMLDQPVSSSVLNTEVNACKLLAYQKVYYDHYRNTAYESNDPFAYNSDNVFAGSAGGRISDATQLSKICKLRYVNYRKDYFQALYPGLNYVLSNPSGLQWTLPNSLVYGSPAIMQLATGATSSDVDKWTTYGNPVSAALSPTYHAIFKNVSSVTPNNLAEINSDGTYSHMQHTHDGAPATASQSASLYNPQAIRAAFALDKLLRASAYAPKHVKDQLEARYGVKLRSTYGHESQYLGSFSNNIQIGEVTATANTEQTSGGVTTGDQLGAIGGKGVSGSTGGKTIEFMCESDSIIIGMAYATVRTMYDSSRIDCFNLKHLREDLPVPEFMDLGLRPLLLMELHNTHDINANNRIPGYVNRDQEYKVGIDENHGLFRLNQQLGVFTVHATQRLASLPASGNGVGMSYFKVSPSDLNSIFETVFDPSSQLTDQFFGQVRFDFSARQNLSVHGQPRL